ncbi:MAG: polysaccharide deacetylase family protein [Clostridium sp.]|nr:polysaccharide deacetylase family protein [Clostridium sp.]
MANIDTLKKVAKISKYTGFTSLCYFLNRNRKRTIAYHNVIPDKHWDNSIHLAHSMKESSFRKQIEVIKKKFDFDLDIYNPKTITLTFDDGYLNQCTVASKVLDENDLNGYFFCVADLINNKKTLDMDMLQYWISYVPYGEYNVEEINLSLNIRDKQSRKSEWQKISDKLDEGIKLCDMKNILDNIFKFEELKKATNHNEMYKIRFNPIDFEGINKMKKNGHKIGAHTAKHLRLSRLSKYELIEDISICKYNMDKLYNTKIFCYPYGSQKDISEEVIEELKKSNFTHSFSYSNGPLNGMDYNDYFMPRMFIPDTDDEELINFVLSGAKHFFSFRKLLPK